VAEINKVIISGTIKYERVPVSTAGLDYNNIESLPVRGVAIQAVDSDGDVLAETDISATGTYSFEVTENTNVKIYFEAKTVSTSDATWDFEVRDNTNDNGIYTFSGSSTNSGTEDSTRNYIIASGWDGSAYSSTRASAPLAILDTIYDAIQLVVVTDPDVKMPAADIFWSINNRASSGEKSDGDIGTSHYTNNTLYILGAENSDTDEFDDHVIAHEWGHYLEDNLSRADSIGGSHSNGNLLDMRIALGEGFGNAFSGMVTSDSQYSDSYGTNQSNGFGFDLEENDNVNPGWYSEGSIQSILYDLYDTADDDADTVSLGFSAIYEALTSDDYINQSSQTSIFSLIHSIKTLNASSATAIDTLVTAQTSTTDDNLGIDVIADNYGSTETHLGFENTLVENAPYKKITDDGVAVEVCSNKTASQYSNGLGVRQLMRLQVASAGNHTIAVNYSRGENIETEASDPDFRLYLNNTFIGASEEENASTESAIAELETDEYILEVYDYNNFVDDNNFGGNVCFNVTVTAS